MTKIQAIKLAARDPGYYARKLRGQWIVWDGKSDHMVDFDGYGVDDMVREDLHKEKGE